MGRAEYRTLSATAFTEGVFGAPFTCYNARQSDLLTRLLGLFEILAGCWENLTFSWSDRRQSRGRDFLLDEDPWLGAKGLPAVP